MDMGTLDDGITVAGGAGAALLANRYRIVRRLGQGGMGSVWLAEDTQLDGKPFAVKMLPSVLVANRRAYRQLKDEALVSMKLTHPNIVTLRAFEENNGNPFLVMDYIDGLTLDDYLADWDGRARTPAAPHVGNGAPSEDEIVSLLKPIAEALDYAHGEGVVHRDVKPANVMIRKDGRPFIMDFGIAREIQETMTRVTGKLSSGTLLYMSPEQLNGDAPKASQDVYGFAAMVYECLTGHPPFYRGAIEDQIRNKEPEPIGGDGIGRARTPAAPSIVPSVMAGLAKRPENRPPTCAAVFSVRVTSGRDSSCVKRRPVAHIAPSPSPRPRAVPPKRIPEKKPPVRSEKRFLKNSFPRALAFATIVASSVALFFFCSMLFSDDGRESAGRAKRQASGSYALLQSEVSGADGFADRINEIGRSLKIAESLYRRKSWNESEKAFTAVAAAAEHTLRNSKERDSAVNLKKMVEDVRRKGTVSEVHTTAPSVWGEAERRYRSGISAFSEMKFRDSAEFFGSAIRMYRRAREAADENAESIAKRFEEAKGCVELVEALPQNGDGFPDMKSACRTLLKKAEMERGMLKWTEAGKSLDKVMEECSKVMRSDREWRSMREALAKAKAAALSADRAGGAEFSAVAWNEGARLMKVGGEAAGRGDFREACAEFTRAAGVYGRCVVESEAAKADLQRNPLPELPALTGSSGSVRKEDGGEKLFIKPLTMNFCRHCGLSLKGMSEVSLKCRRCGKSLFGEDQ